MNSMEEFCVHPGQIKDNWQSFKMIPHSKKTDLNRAGGFQLKMCDGRTDARTNGRTDERTEIFFFCSINLEW